MLQSCKSGKSTFRSKYRQYFFDDCSGVEKKDNSHHFRSSNSLSPTNYFDGMALFQTGMSSVVMETPKKLASRLLVESENALDSRAENDSLSAHVRRITTFGFEMEAYMRYFQSQSSKNILTMHFLLQNLKIF